MKILVLSDSHGNIDNMARAVELIRPRHILHLGDCLRDAQALHERFPDIPMDTVPGNCDWGSFDTPERLLEFDGVLAAFDRVIGLDRLRAVHVNDSLNPCGAKKDRHARIGEGTLGLETFRRIVNHPALQGLPMVLETPNELPGYAREIALLRDMRTAP